MGVPHAANLVTGFAARHVRAPARCLKGPSRQVCAGRSARRVTSTASGECHTSAQFIGLSAANPLVEGDVRGAVRGVVRPRPRYLAANTLVETRRILDTALLPRWGGVPLAKLRPEHLERRVRRAAPGGTQ